MKLRIMTYNIASGMNYEETRERDLRFAQGVIEEYQPDILGLNEVQEKTEISQYTSQTQTLAQALEMYGYFGPAISMRGGLYGNALLSRFAASSEVIGIPDPLEKTEDVYYETRCLMKNEIYLGQKLTVLVTHFGLAYQERLNAVKIAVEVIKAAEGPVIFMGDLNAEPNDEELAPLHRLLKDTASLAQEPLYTVPSDRPDRKIDYIFVSPQVQVNRVWVPASRASDHRPYIAEIEV